MQYPEFILFTGTRSDQASNSDIRGSSGPGDPTVTRLVVTRLVPIVQDLFAAGVATGTKRVYGSGSSRYEKFCSITELSAYPVTENALMPFIAHLYNEGLSP